MLCVYSFGAHHLHHIDIAVITRGIKTNWDNFQQIAVTFSALNIVLEYLTYLLWDKLSVSDLNLICHIYSCYINLRLIDIVLVSRLQFQLLVSIQNWLLLGCF